MSGSDAWWTKVAGADGPVELASGAARLTVTAQAAFRVVKARGRGAGLGDTKEDLEQALQESKDARKDLERQLKQAKNERDGARKEAREANAELAARAAKRVAEMRAAEKRRRA